MSNSTVYANVTFDSTLGPILIGALFSMCLWGVACAQTYEYFMESNRNSTDGLMQKLPCFGSFRSCPFHNMLIFNFNRILVTLNSIMDSHLIYFYSVTNFGNPAAIKTPIWSLNYLAVVQGISNYIIRVMFVRRIYQFGRKNIIVTAWIMFISTCDLVVSMVGTISEVRRIYSVLRNISKLLYLNFALGVTADLSVTVALCWLLQSAKTGFHRTDTLVNVLMAYVVNTGLLVTMGATVAMIIYIAMPQSLIYLGFYLILSTLYVNAYLASLNARTRLRGINSESSSIPLSRLTIPQSTSVQSPDETTNVFHNLAISFQKTVERKVDGDDDIKSHGHA